MVHQLEHRNIAPVVVVIARALEMQLIAAVIGDVRHGASLGDRGKPREIMFLVVAEENTSRLRTPGSDRSVKCEARTHCLALENNVIVLEVAAAEAFADLDVALVLGVMTFLDRSIDLPGKLSAVGKSQLHRRDRFDRPVNGDRHLRKEEQDEHRAVGVVRIIVPPFIRALRAIDARSILPEFDLVFIQTHLLIMQRVIGMY